MRALLALCCACLLLLSSALVRADEISIDIETIYASSGDPSVDSSLVRLQKELQAAFPSFQQFTLVERTKLTIPLNDSRIYKLPDADASELVISYDGLEDSLLSLHVGLKGKIAADVKASPGSTFFQAGLKYERGILVLAIEPNLVETP